MGRAARWTAVACALAAAPALAAVAVSYVPPAATAGEAEAKAGTKGVWVWADAKGVHVRWGSDGTPVLFSGRLLLDKDAGALTRVNKLAGGFVDVQNDRWILFSATALGELDGFDVVVPGGAVATLELQVDGADADPALVSFGKNAFKPRSLPAKFSCR